jgi:hypothetical protein
LPHKAGTAAAISVFVAIILFVGQNIGVPSFVSGSMTAINSGGKEDPIFASHQSFAHSGKSSGDYTTLTKPYYPNNLGGVFYGPCFHPYPFSYTWCLKRESISTPGILIVRVDFGGAIDEGPAHGHAGDFTIHVNAAGINCNNYPPFRGSAGQPVSLGPGSCTYSITETGPYIQNYTSSVSSDSDCSRGGSGIVASGTLNPGETNSCTITQRYAPFPHT